MLDELNALIPDDALRAKILALLEAELAQKEAKQKELEETLEYTILSLHGEVREKLRLQEEFRKKADEKFRIAAELAGDYIYEATIDGGKVRAMYVSPEFTTLTGYSMNEINQGEGWLDLIHPDDLPYFRAIMESASIGRPIVIEYRVRRKDGGTIWLRDFSRPILDETGRYLKSIGISRNITAEKEAELALQRERQLLDIIFNTVPIGICLSDENGTFLRVNQALADISGYDANELLGRHFSIIVAEEHRAFAKEAHQTFMQGASLITSGESMVQRKDGERRWVAFTARKFQCEDGRWYRVTAMRDITKKREQEEEIARLLELLARTESLARIGSWEFDFETYRFTKWSDEMFRIYERPMELGAPTGEEYSALYISAETNERLQSWVNELIRSGGEGEIEIPITTHNGNRKFIRVREVIAFQDGTPISAQGMVQDITEERRQKEETKRLLELLGRTESLAHIGSWEFDFETYRFTKWSDEMFRIYERPMELGVPETEEFKSRCLSPETVARLEDWTQELIRAGGEGEIELPTTTYKGNHKFIRVRAVITFKDGKPIFSQGMTEDITEERRQKEETKRLLELLGRTESLARIGSWELDLKTNRFTKWSDELFRIYERPLELGPPTFEEYKARYISPEDDARMWQWAEKELYQKQSDAAEFEFSLTTHKGNHKFVRMRASMIYENGVPVRVQGSKQDITREKLLEKQKEELMAQLIQAQKMEAIGTLTGGIAHEFNNILGGMLGNLRLLEKKFGHDPSVKKYTDRLIELNQRAANIISQMLGFARKGKYQPQPLSLKVCIHNALQILVPTTDRRIRFHTEIEGDLPLIYADPTQMEQVILNLAKNAIDAIEPLLGKEREHGHITFRLAFEPVASRFRRKACAPIGEQPMVLLEVRDNGMGIPKEIQNHIFEPFFTTKPVGKGTGLGLPMVYGIVENHGGCLFLESEVGKGTSFFLYFPAVERTAMQPRSNPATAAVNLSGVRVLVIDDEAMVREVLSEYLSELGAEVAVAEDGTSGIGLFGALPKDNLVVILDLNMPDKSGEQVLRELLAIDRNVKVIIGTGYMESEQIHHLYAQGALCVLTKPYMLDDIAKEVAAVMNLA